MTCGKLINNFSNFPELFELKCQLLAISNKWELIAIIENNVTCKGNHLRPEEIQGTRLVKRIFIKKLVLCANTQVRSEKHKV